MKKRIITFILCFALCFVMVGGSILPGFCFIVSAAQEELSFDERYIENDFEDLNIDMTVYQKNVNDEPSVIQLFEYCYSEDYSTDEYYGVYIYVYNPSEEPIDEVTSLNCVNMAVEYDKDGEATDYEKLQIEFLDRTDNCRFYKFKVVDSAKLLNVARLYAYNNENARRYNLVGLEIKYEGANLAKDFEVKNSYVFSGYAKGCSAESQSESTLTCSHNGLAAINLSLNHTTWTNPNFDANYETTRITSVYFGIPKKYFEDYSKLVQIHCTWDQLTAKGMFVTSSQGRYDELIEKVGVNIGVGSDDLTTRIFWEEEEYHDLAYVRYTFNSMYNAAIQGVIKFPKVGDSGYKLGTHYAIGEDAKYYSSIEFLFKSLSNPESVDDYFISGEIIENYMKWYTEKYPNTEKMLGYSSDLFVPNSHKHRDVYIGDKEVEITVNGERNWFYELFGYYPTENITFRTINVLDFNTINEMTDEKFEEAYHVDNKNIGTNTQTGNVRQDCIQMFENGLIPVILNFSVDKYYASKARFDNTDYWHNGEGSGEVAGVNGYVAQQSLFLNFDIISLKFEDKNGAVYVIPVIADPINVIAGLTAPTDIIEEPWWRILVILLTVIIIILAIMFLSGPLSVVFNLLWSGVKFILKILLWIIKLPFKAISGLVRRR